MSAAASLARTLSAVGALIGALEVMVVSRNYAPGGIFSWNVLRTQNALLASPRWSAYFDAALSRKGVVALNGVKAAAACVLLVPHLPSAVYAAACLLIVVVYCVLVLRSGSGHDGSDQMLVILMSGLFLYFSQPDGFIGAAGLWFIAAQALLAYLASGVAKLASPTWRRGRALRLIFHTATYGSRSVSQLLDRWPVLDALGCWSVIVVECGFIAVLVLPPHAALAVLALGALFHAGTAVTMGLNVFFWEFVATYPIVLACAALLQSSVSASLPK